MPKVKRTSRNSQLRRGVFRLGRAAASKKHHFKKPISKTTEEKKVDTTTTKEPRWYAADDVSKPLPSRKKNHKPTRLRNSITPGTVLILLAGKFRGKRVVFLKQLKSGLLLVTGPYKVNGVPLRRVNQRYVIATSTKLDVSGVNARAVTDSFFKKKEKNVKKNDEFFNKDEEQVSRSQEQKDAQKSVDTAILSKLDKLTKSYLNARFSLSKNEYPHLMKF